MAPALGYFLLAGLLAACLLFFAAEPAHAATTFTVNSTGDENDLDFLPSGTFDGSSDGECDVDSDTTGDQCTLRAAIQEANVTLNVGGLDLIDFAIPEDPNDPADDLKTILVGGTPSPTADTSLPIIREAVTINGYSQPGASPNTNTDLADGTDANLLIELNGTLTGTSGSPGLRIEASNVVVKGLVINRFNAGIFIFGAGSGNRIEGNFIGTDPFGGTQFAVGNRDYGVTVFGSSGANIIGGTDADDGTVDGVVEARNLISGNLKRGLQIFGNGGNTIQGNLVGTKANGTEALGNGREGVQIFSPNNTVGNSTGDDEAGANLIAFNGTDGVQVVGGPSAFAVGNRILSNSIFSNGGPAEGALGIDLDGIGFSNPDGDGVTANDSDDTDTGPNTLQNFPVLTSATRSGLDGSTTIEGALNSTASTTFTVQFFSNPSADPSNHGEGKTYLGQKSDVTTDPSGNASFTFTTQENVALGHFVTATATRLDTSTNPATPTNTSEFSEVEEVKVGNDPPVNSVPGEQSTNEDSALDFSQANNNQVSVSDPDAGTSSVQVKLQANHGSMTLDGTSGLTFNPGDSGTNDADMTFTGSLSDVNAALDGMRFDPTANYNGGATLTITTDDQGNTGAGGAKTDTDTVNITVSAVNDAPSFTKGANQIVQDKAGAQLVATWATNISVGPPNELTQSLQFIVTSSNNSLFTATGRPAVSSNGTLTYTPRVNANGTANVSVAVRDSGGTANGGVDTSDAQSFTITVNDATPPKVKSTTPTNGLTGVSPTANLTATFSEAMNANTLTNPSTLRSNTFTLVRKNADGTTTRVAAIVTYNATTKTATLNPDTHLRLGATYTATVTAGARDLAGNRLDQNPSTAGNQPRFWRFTVRA
jgi:hypothetical protein